MGAERDHPFVKECLAYYENRHFLKPDGTPDIQTIAPFIYADIARNYGFEYINAEQQLTEGIHIYPTVLFSPNIELMTTNAVAVHCCVNSWRKRQYTPSFIQKIKDFIKDILFFCHIPCSGLLAPVRKHVSS